MRLPFALAVAVAAFLLVAAIAAAPAVVLVPSLAHADANVQFTGIDRNLDGVIDRQEARVYRGRLIRTLDLNGNGEITRDEWIDAIKARSVVTPEKEPETPKEFREADADSNNIVTSEEMHAVGERRFKALDSNEDGVISKEEYRENGL